MSRYGRSGSPEDEGFDPALASELDKWAKNTGLTEADITPKEEQIERERIENIVTKTNTGKQPEAPTAVDAEDNFKDLEIADRLGLYPDLKDINPAAYPKDRELLEFAKARLAIRETEIPDEGFLGMGKGFDEALRKLIELAKLDKYTLGTFDMETIDRMGYLMRRLEVFTNAYEEKSKNMGRYYRYLLARELLDKLKKYKEQH